MKKTEKLKAIELSIDYHSELIKKRNDELENLFAKYELLKKETGISDPVTEELIKEYNILMKILKIKK